jgi:hypothetical protein
MVGTPTSRRAVYYFVDYEESKDQGRQRITRQHVTVPKTVPTNWDNSLSLQFQEDIGRIIFLLFLENKTIND